MDESAAQAMADAANFLAKPGRLRWHGGMKRLIALVFCVAVPVASAGNPYRVEIDTTQTPEHAKWAEPAARVATDWFPRIVNLIGSPVAPAAPVVVKAAVSKDYKGVAVTQGGRITLSNDWVTAHPDDSVGVIIHELVHVVQSYPPTREVWLVEGIADYVRFGIYEGRPLGEFPVSDKPDGYLDSYQVAAGFLLWLESGRSPGIVRRLSTALKRGGYDPSIFAKHGGEPLDKLWETYRRERISNRNVAVPVSPSGGVPHGQNR